MTDAEIEAIARTYCEVAEEQGAYVNPVACKARITAALKANDFALIPIIPTEVQKTAYQEMLDERGIGVAMQLEDIIAMLVTPMEPT